MAEDETGVSPSASEAGADESNRRDKDDNAISLPAD
jgi:hypothetical protein